MTFILFIANCRNRKQVRGREGESVWGGAAGGWGKCGRGTRVCAQMNHSSTWCATGLSGRESKSWGKIWVSSTSYQTLTATLLHSTRFLLCLSFLFSYSFALFYSDTHPHAQTHTHTHQPSLLAERRRDHRRTVKHLYCYSLSSSAIAMPRMWTLILGVMLGLLASSRSEIQGEEIVPFPSGFRFVWGFIFLILPKLYRSLRQQEFLKRF